MKIKEKISNFFKKPTATDLKLRERSVRSRNRLRQQAFDYQEFVKRSMQEKTNEHKNQE
jgi:hypothetical protein